VSITEVTNERTIMPHTPGPWAIEYDRGVPRTIRQQVDSDVGVSLIARWDLTHLEEMTANAKLIAAAPDLLAALQLVMSRVEELVKEMEAVHESPTHEAENDFAIIKAAIKKATE
jgi:hypothetical protein